MNIKKYIEQQAEKDAESLITESDREFCMQLAIKAQQTAPKRRKFKSVVISSMATVCVVALVLGITLPLTLNKQSAANEIFYKEENVDKVACTIEDVNNNSKYFKVEETEGFALHYQLHYDSITEDKLYYSVDVTNGMVSTFTLYIIVNKNYSYDFEKYEDLLHEQLTQYDIEYNIERVGSAMLTELKYRGIIKVESETVYIDYTQNIDIGDEAFFGDIQSVLKLKN